MKIGETNRLGVQAIQVRRLQGRISMTGEIAVPLIIRHDQNDIGLFRLDRRRQQQQQTSGRWACRNESIHSGFPLHLGFGRRRCQFNHEQRVTLTLRRDNLLC